MTSRRSSNGQYGGFRKRPTVRGRLKKKRNHKRKSKIKVPEATFVDNRIDDDLRRSASP